MLKVSSRLGVVALAMALVLVPTLARARQSVEHRDATRLSIKHSWVGVAPTAKAVVAPQQVVVVHAVARQPEAMRTASRLPVAVGPALRAVCEPSSDPLRGPPSTPLA